MMAIAAELATVCEEDYMITGLRDEEMIQKIDLTTAQAGVLSPDQLFAMMAALLKLAVRSTV
jgi:hypothetical protein